MDPPLSVPIMNGFLLKYTHIEGVFQIHYDIDLIYQFQNEAVNTRSNPKKLQVHTMPTLYFIMYLTLYFPLPTSLYFLGQDLIVVNCLHHQ